MKIAKLCAAGLMFCSEESWPKIGAKSLFFLFIFLLVESKLACRSKISLPGCLEVVVGGVWVVGGWGLRAKIISGFSVGQAKLL